MEIVLVQNDLLQAREEHLLVRPASFALWNVSNYIANQMQMPQLFVINYA